MDKVCKDIFRAIHEGKWLSIEYKNKEEKLTRYWIGIKDLNIRNKTLSVEGLHLTKMSLLDLTIFIDSIIFSEVIDASYCEKNERLIKDINLNPHKYQDIFIHIPNLKILNYLEDCNKLDSSPYKTDYSLIGHLDDSTLSHGAVKLSDEQFKQMIKDFQQKALNNDTKSMKMKEICMNILSIHTKDGLYVLAYRKLSLDVKRRRLKPSDEITVCREFTINGEKQSIRKFMDGDDYELLEAFEQNLEIIKDKISHSNKYIYSVDDMPYIVAIGRNRLIDLEKEYSAILNMYNNDAVTDPVKAFFGDLVKRPIRRKVYPLALLNKKVNVDQLLAINNAIKYPLAYIQGPPGTGKTNTIINTIITGFFNEKTVLFSSYNNHPIDSVFQTLTTIRYKDKYIPFPVIRLGNNDKVHEALNYIEKLYDKVKNVKIFDKTLQKNKDEKIKRTEELMDLLIRHERKLDLEEREESIEKMLQSSQHLRFHSQVQGRQLSEINEELKKIGNISDEEVQRFLAEDEDEFYRYLYYTSASYIQKLNEPKNKDLRSIIEITNKDLRISKFNKYLSDEANLKKLMHIFPIILTTCISAHKLGTPKEYFDMVIIDEASQCNTAISLVPIIRGRNLMLVGDPQQLNPVILLDAADNQKLKKIYSVTNEYDYNTNSIYKTYLACDSVSDEVLLSYHYRCHEKIINFNNKKYYNSKLNIKSSVVSEKPLVYVDIEDNYTDAKNTSPAEAEHILNFIQSHIDKNIGIITPFTKQKDLINKLLSEKQIRNVTCGTVHAFQGDEKDIILFSLALTDQTNVKTYDWLRNNKELINVATSRAKEQLVIYSSNKNMERLHGTEAEDDIYELVKYVQSNGETAVTEKLAASRALGTKPYSTETEEAFLSNLNHALGNIFYNNRKCSVHKEVAISQVFRDNLSYSDLFYTGRFDFVVYEKSAGRQEIPVLAIELDGKEHFEDEVVKQRDKKKNEICSKHGLELIRIENTYARRYQYMKDILENYFTKSR